MKTFFFYIYLLICVLVTVPTLCWLKFNKKLSQEERYAVCTKVAKKFSSRLIRFTGSKFEIEGIENVPKDGAVLFVSNHQSNFDAGFFMAYVDKPKGYVAKAELEKVPILNTWMKEINCLFMDRNDMKEALKTIIEGINILKSGHSLIIFPEGTRSIDGKMMEFKAGSFKLALKAKVPIIPVTIDGSNNIMDANNNRIKAVVVKVYIHPPVDTKDLTAEEALAIPEKVKGIIASKLKVIY